MLRENDSVSRGNLKEYGNDWKEPYGEQASFVEVIIAVMIKLQLKLNVETTDRINQVTYNSMSKRTNIMALLSDPNLANKLRHDNSSNNNFSRCCKFFHAAFIKPFCKKGCHKGLCIY